MTDGHPKPPLNAGLGDEPGAELPARPAWIPCCGCLLALALLLAAAAVGAKLYEEVSRGRARATLAALDAEGLGLKGLFDPTPPEPNAATLLQPALKSMEEFGDAPEAMCAGFDMAFLAELRDPDSVGERFFLPPDTDDGPKTLKAAVALVVERLNGLDASVDAALEAPACVFPLEWQAGLLMDVPHLMPLKLLVRTYGTRAIRRQLDGDSAGAWADVTRMVRLLELLDEPLLISRLVRVAMISVVLGTVEALLHAGAPPDEQRLSLLSDSLHRLEARSGFTRAVRGELHMEATATADFAVGASDVPFERLPLLGDALFSGWRADLLEVCADQIRASRLPPLQAQAELQRIEQRVAESGSLLAAMLSPALARAHTKELKGVAELRLIRAALALACSGSLPEELGVTAPIDPLDPNKGPLRWRRTGERSGDLWSVGPDQVDDGGSFPHSGTGQSKDVPFRIRLPD